MSDAWKWFEQNKHYFSFGFAGGALSAKIASHALKLNPYWSAFLGGAEIGMLAGEHGAWDYVSQHELQHQVDTPAERLRLTRGDFLSSLHQYREYDPHDAARLSAKINLQPVAFGRGFSFSYRPAPDFDAYDTANQAVRYMRDRMQEIDSAKAMETRWIIGGPQLDDFVALMPRLKGGFSPALSGLRGAAEATLFDPTFHGSLTKSGPGFSRLDSLSRARLSSYGSFAHLNSFGSGGLPSIIGTPTLRQEFENYCTIQEMQRNTGLSSIFQNPPDVKLFDFNSKAKLGLTSFHNQWDVSPYSDANQSILFTESSTPRSGISPRSFFDPAPNFHRQFHLSNPASLTSHMLGGSQLGFNPFAGSGLGGLGGTSNIGRPLFNNWSMFNPSQNLNTLGSGALPAPFGGVGAGFSR